MLDQANVQADRGAGVSAGDNEKLADHIARAKEMKPSVLFLSYGMNDVGAAEWRSGWIHKSIQDGDQRSEKITAGYENIC